MKKSLLLTFDYELFLGNRSGTVDECMIQPTSEIASILQKHGAKAIFFIDTTYLMTLEKYSFKYEKCKHDFENVCNQLRELSRDHHEIFPHIHPHWLQAEYMPEINQWKLGNTSLYRFHHLSLSQREEVFTGSVKLLRSILGDNARPIDGFRAGGWSVQPFSDFSPYFKQTGIKYEFSVIPGYYHFTDAQYFDFTSAPHKDYYAFSDDVTVETLNGEYLEFTASMLEVSKGTQLLDKFITKLRYKLLNDHTFNKGSGQSPKELKHINPKRPDGIKLGDHHKERVAIELLTAIKLPAYLRYLENNNYMLFISHPKMITGHSMKTFDQFLSSAYSKYSLNTDFRTLSSAS